MGEVEYISSNDIFYEGVLSSIRKSKEKLQPLFEAFTNSLESIKISGRYEGSFINIKLYHKTGTTQEDFIFDKLVIEDNGVGFDEENFSRMKIFRDTRKGFSNKGTGRIQFIHFFEKAKYSSYFTVEDMNYERNFTISKNFLKNNAIICHDGIVSSDKNVQLTKLTLLNLIDNKDQVYFDKLNIDVLKNQILDRYIMEFCDKRQKLPDINIQSFINDIQTKETCIKIDDIPKEDKKDLMEINYQTLSDDGKEFIKLDKKENIYLTSFKISDSSLDKNEIKLTSKGEIRPYPRVKLDSLRTKDSIDNNRFLFLLSGDFLDQCDTDTRGTLNIAIKKDFKHKFINSIDMFEDGEIFIDDIIEYTNKKIINNYPEIRKKNQQVEHEIEKLQSMFLLNEDTIDSLKFSVNDSDETILEKVYQADAKTIAKNDALIKNQIDKLSEFDTTSEDYLETLNHEVNELVKIIPIQNRTALTHYVARRKLVLDLFNKILDQQLKIQETGNRKLDEKLLHNLIFQQSSSNPEISDLWIIEEDFIYFKGFSEKSLSNITIDGKKIFNKKFTEEEDRYLKSLGENRLLKRPDVLLFPDEGKCILIEFKAPDVNISEHLNQIDFYANLIRNYTVNEIQITSFYGYLIGEDIEDRDVRGRVSRFEHSYHLDFWFRPSENVNGFDGRSNGNIYTEVIKYSTLLKRAKIRNNIFIGKLSINNDE